MINFDETNLDIIKIYDLDSEGVHHIGAFYRALKYYFKAESECLLFLDDLRDITNKLKKLNAKN